MNKTISINIGGLFFQIDEEAYKLLENYLDSLKNHFANTEGKEEILQDIESRIAEIFQVKIENGAPIIVPADVEEAIKILGKPDDIGSSEESKEGKQEKSSPFKKRLYRDEDNKVLGGVCSGLGHYFNVDPVWFRIGFIVALFIFGSSALVYLILWIIIPKATTTEEKLNMKGEPMTISEIQENIKSEFEELKARFKEMKGDAKNHTRREYNDMKRRMHRAKRESAYSNRQRQMAAAISRTQSVKESGTGVGSVFGEIIYYFLRALLIFAGIVLLIIGIVVTVSLVLSITAPDSFLFFTKWGISSVSFPAFSQVFFENPWQQHMAFLSLILLIGVPLLMLIFNSIRMIAGFKTKIRVVSITASLLWLTGLILAIILTINIVGNFSEKSIYRQEVMLPQTRETLVIDVADNLPLVNKTQYFDDDFFDSDPGDHEHFVFNNCFFSDGNDKLVVYGFPKLKIIPSKTGTYKLTVIKFSRGTTLMNARRRAESIRFDTPAADSVLLINNYFLLAAGEKWRNQSVKLILEVPEGKSVYLSKNLENLVYDRDNLDGSWDFDMLGKKMYMVNGRLTGDVVVVTDTIKNPK
ncbi:MAG TPA: PspC domain-containing protein [Bacteroidales bacterium]|nr:PspC domain-containing protein [Bacteroidales bacterium]